MDNGMSKVLNVGVRENVDKNTYTITAEISDGLGDFREALNREVLVLMAKKYVEEHGEEIIASIDLETIKKKTTDKIVVQALKELLK